MNQRQAIKYSIIYILTILFGVFIAFKVWWTNGGARFLGIIAFFLVGFGSLFLSISLTRIIVPIKTDFSFSTLSDKNKYQILKDTIGSAKVKVISITYFSLFLILFAGTAFAFVTSLNKYENYHLMNFGQLQKVRINDIQFKGKRASYAFFDYYLDGKKYTYDLRSKKYSIGDSATIIFSTNNTDIVKWAEDYDAIVE